MPTPPLGTPRNIAAFRARFRLEYRPRIRAVFDAWGRKRRLVLFRTGGFTRSAVRRSMRSSPNSAPQGRPPRKHAGNLSNLMWFDVHSGDTAVTIGPLPFPRAKRRVRPLGLPDGRALLEFGGVARVRSSSSGRSRGRRRYGARPYMAPKRPLAVQKLRENLRTIPLR